MSIGMMMFTYLPVFIILFILGVCMPNLTRKEIFFGIRIPKDKAKDSQLINLKREYVKKYLLICGGFLAILIVALFYSKNPMIPTIGVFIYIILQSMIYLNIHKKVKEYKAKSNWNEGKKEVVIVDTSFRNKENKRMLVSKAWFLIPLAIIVLNIIIGFKVYANLPDPMPIHWNGKGIVDRWAPKSYKTIFIMPASQLFMMIIMYIVYKTIGMAKVQINASNPVVSREQNRRFRYIWSGYIIFITSVISLIFTFINFNMLSILKWTPKQMVIVPMIFTAVLLIVTIVIALMTGQGGSRLNIKEEENHQNHIDRNDDKHWKLGMFYVNKNDPAIIVEKRFGIGWTINFGNVTGIVFFVMLIAFIIGYSVITSRLN
ncbi:DUF1648 domain-containing protein [Clostridium ganghwense]|uniref:DUF1648 domain-containing protein n=1 Tax=Clostridium ganghwense TaxID=312089 RepID=A0ABT4CLY0_9CLOT|nr:DUF1648 domain-containing protein [Clostridium ganghwense]MCY6370043.1 DUF1648 domain-containing protein [Clostridium ganghwense]